MSILTAPSERFPTGRPLPHNTPAAPETACFPWSLRGLTSFAIPDELESLLDGSVVYDHHRQIAVAPATGEPAARSGLAASERSVTSAVPEDTLPDVVLDGR